MLVEMFDLVLTTKKNMENIAAQNIELRDTNEQLCTRIDELMNYIDSMHDTVYALAEELAIVLKPKGNTDVLVVGEDTIV